jgi:SAM-dependent methyltransferase
MYNFHQDKPTYFQWQYRISAEYIIPFVSEHIDLEQPKKILEIGCAEAGVLKAFTEKKHICTGIEMNPRRAKMASEFLAAEIKAGLLDIISSDIYDIDLSDDTYKFDLIILKDVIEHIHDQDRFMRRLGDMLNPGGIVFFGFPPWQMPFGGHQQIADKKWVSVLPYFHLLPMSIYKLVLKLLGENKKRIAELVEIKETGISIERFESILQKEKFSILRKQLFLINPIYQYKFGLKVRKQNKLIGKIPFLRNYITTCAYYLIK